MNADISNKSLLTVEQIFKETFFKIPDYQRGYSWQCLQREELIEDIELLPIDKSHYTGTLVLHFNSTKKQEDYRGNSYSELDVVDGQQRLTSLVILLDAIRLKLNEIGETSLAEGLREGYIAIEDQNRQLQPKLKLNKDCHDFFINDLLNFQGSIDGPRIRSHLNLMNARKEFSVYLNQKQKELDGEYLDWLKAFRKKICQQLSFTVYTVDQATDVGVIFEVMNNRGLKLTELEKVKNYLLYICSKLELKGNHDDTADYINSTWTHIFESLMQNNLANSEHENQFLNMHWFFYSDYNLKNWRGSKSIKNRFHLRDYKGKHEQLLDNIKKYVRSLRDACTVYCDIENPTGSDAFNSFRKHGEIKIRIEKFSEKLCRLNVLFPFMPLLMAIRMRFPSDAELYLKAVKLCEIYSFFVYTYSEKRGDAGRSSLYKYANELYNDKNNYGDIFASIVLLLHRYSPPEVLFEQLKFDLNEKKSDWYHWKGIKYFLYEYEEALSGGRAVRISWNQLENSNAKQNSIEHILPQSPDNEYWNEHFTKEQIEICTHDIGNLSLTFDNSSYGRKPFPAKKGTTGQAAPCYANSPIFMEKALCNYDVWDINAIAKRRQEIISWAIKRWQIPYEEYRTDLLEHSKIACVEEDTTLEE